MAGGFVGRLVEVGANRKVQAVTQKTETQKIHSRGSWDRPQRFLSLAGSSRTQGHKASTSLSNCVL